MKMYESQDFSQKEALNMKQKKAIEPSNDFDFWNIQIPYAMPF